MKKVALLVLALTLLGAAFAACSSNGNGPPAPGLDGGLADAAVAPDATVDDAGSDAVADGGVDGGVDGNLAPVDAGHPDASRLLTAVNVTSLPGASVNQGTGGVFVNSVLVSGTGTAPAVSNTVVSAIPGAPAKPFFVSQAQAFDSVLVGVQGERGFFTVASNNPVLGLDLITSAKATPGTATLLVATQTGSTISAAAPVTLVLDAHVVVAAGDLGNHDTAGTTVADLFGAVLEGLQGSPAKPMQIVTNTNNNALVDDAGVKGPPGPVATGHREVVWDGVPAVLRDTPSFSPTFFDRQAAGASGVRGGVLFASQADGGAEEVNDALDGGIPDAAATLGGDFSNVNPSFAGDLLAFTQPADFAPIGTTVTDVTFHVAGSSTAAVVVGMGVVFISVDHAMSSSVEFFDETSTSLAKVYVPPQSKGPFPYPGPLSAGSIPYSFAGFVDRAKRIARVRIVNGEIPVDQATSDVPAGGKDVVVFDDVYYGEPKP